MSLLPARQMTVRANKTDKSIQLIFVLRVDVQPQPTNVYSISISDAKTLAQNILDAVEELNIAEDP